MTTKPPDSAIGRRRSEAKAKGSPAYLKRREEITRAAAEVFNRRGFRGTNFSQVAQELSTDRATLYYYVGSKEELFDSVVRTAAERDVALAEAVLDSDSEPLEKIRALVTALMNSYAENYPLLYVYMRENLAYTDTGRPDWSKAMRALNRRYDRAVTSIVQQGIDDGSIDARSSAKVIAFGIIGMVGWTNRWFVPGASEVTAAEIGEAYADIVVRGLRSQESSADGSSSGRAGQVSGRSSEGPASRQKQPRPPVRHRKQ
jgi:TetR/AcrR family transcriptional regulator, cholesterol catabolism regulator